MRENPHFRKYHVRQVFESWVDYYATAREKTPWLAAQLKIVEGMLWGKNGLVLDIGCAAGAELSWLNCRGFQVIGTDLSSQMLLSARKRFPANSAVQLCAADLESLPFRANSVDHVVCLGVLEYLPSYSRALNEIHRVLRPGGSAVFSIPTRISFERISYKLCHWTVIPAWRKMRRILGDNQARLPLSLAWNRCLPWSFRRLLQYHGLQPRVSAYSGFLIFPLEQVWPAAQVRIAGVMEHLSDSWLLGWTLSQYLICVDKNNTTSGAQVRNRLPKHCSQMAQN